MKHCILILFLFCHNCWAQSQVELLNLKEGDNFLLYEIIRNSVYNCELIKITRVGETFNKTKLLFRIDSMHYLKNIDLITLTELFNQLDTLGDTIREKIIMKFNCKKQKSNSTFFDNVVYNNYKTIHQYQNKESICEVIKTFDSLDVCLIDIRNRKPIMDLLPETYLIKRNFGSLGTIGNDYNGKMCFDSILSNYNGLEINQQDLKKLILEN